MSHIAPPRALLLASLLLCLILVGCGQRSTENKPVDSTPLASSGEKTQNGRGKPLRWADAATETLAGDGLHVGVLTVEKHPNTKWSDVVILLANRTDDNVIRLRYEKYLDNPQKPLVWEVALKDQLGNSYDVDKEIGVTVALNFLSRPLPPKESRVVHIYHPQPVQAAKTLFLTIPSPVEEGTKTFRFQIPIQAAQGEKVMFRRADADRWFRRLDTDKRLKPKD